MELVKEVTTVAADQPRGATHEPRELRSQRGTLNVWTIIHSDGTRYAGVFNVGDIPLPLELALKEIGFSGVASSTELWSGTPAQVTASVLQTTEPPHDVRLYSFS